MTDADAEHLVLDSWPMLEWINGKVAGPSFAEMLERARSKTVRLSMSRMNYGEVLYTCRKELKLRESQVGRVIDVFYDLPIEIVSVTDVRVDAAVDLKSRYNISYADAFAAGLAIEFGVFLVTGDREFRELARDGLVSLHWMGV